jgi:protein O-mannosyl-transferase
VRPVLLLLALILVTLAAYQPAWHGGPLWDDDAHLTPAALQSPGGLRRIWTEVNATPQYYPVVHSTFWLFHKAWGDDPFGYHLANILLHACSAFLVGLILMRLGVRGAVLAAVIFALHPVHVESVAWMTELKNTLSGVFYLLAILAYLRFDTTREKSLYGLALGLFGLALLSKSVTATLPAAVLVIVWWQRGRIDLKRDVMPLVPFFVIGAVSGLATVWIEQVVIGAHGAEYDYNIFERCLIAGRAIWFYLVKLVWPSNLTFIYPRWDISLSDWRQFLYPAGLVAVLAIFWLLRSRSRAPLAALVFFIVTLGPAIGFVNVYPFRYSFVADHFQYLASIGPIALVAGAARGWGWAANRDSKRPNRIREKLTLIATIAAIGLPLGVLTWRQSHLYVDGRTIYRATIERNPSCWMAYNNLGELKLNGAPGELDEAIALFNQALQLKPDLPEAHNNLGFAWQKLGRFEEAVAEHERALALQRDYVEAHYNLGIEYQALGRIDEATKHYRAALQINPAYDKARYNLGMMLQQTGAVEEAAPLLAEGVRGNPSMPEFHVALGMTLQRLGRTDEAIAEFQEAVRLKPSSADALNNLGVALLSRGRVEEALRACEEAVRLMPESGMARANLGYALLRTGRTSEAATQLTESLRLQPSYGPAHYIFANVLQQTGRLEEAAQEYRASLALQSGPATAQIHNDLGVTLARLGRMREAIAQFNEALRVKPDHAEARANLLKASRGRS